MDRKAQLELAQVALTTEDDDLLDLVLLASEPEPEKPISPNYRLNLNSLSEEDCRFYFRLNKGELWQLGFG